MRAGGSSRARFHSAIVESSGEGGKYAVITASRTQGYVVCNKGPWILYLMNAAGNIRVVEVLVVLNYLEHWVGRVLGASHFSLRGPFGPEKRTWGGETC